MYSVVSGLTKEEARGVEQAFISIYTLEALDNARREIANKNVEKAGKEGARALELVTSLTENDCMELMKR